MIFFQFCIKNLGLFQIKKVKTQLNREKNHSYLIANLFYRIILNSKCSHKQEVGYDYQSFDIY